MAILERRLPRLNRRSMSDRFFRRPKTFFGACRKMFHRIPWFVHLILAPCDDLPMNRPRLAVPYGSLICRLAIIRNPSFARAEPLARLLDWLAWEYRLLFLVSAGNQMQPIEPDVDGHGFRQLPDYQAIERVLQAIHDDQPSRRHWSPAEAVNALRAPPWRGRESFGFVGFAVAHVSPNARFLRS